MRRDVFGTLSDGRLVHAFTLANSYRTEICVINLGGIVASCRTLDRHGRSADVVLGFDRFEPYLHESPYFGAIVGRYANRIAAGRFVLDGCEYQLVTNDGVNHLHGGICGFDKALWQARSFTNGSGAGVSLHQRSEAGEEGYPGTVDVSVTYTLTDTNALEIEYSAVSDAPTPVNLTHHSYFNLAGEGEGDILDHRLEINAAGYTPVDATLIPTGDIAPVADTPFDFREEMPIGLRIHADDAQLRIAGGYDHNYVLSGANGGLRTCAGVWEPVSGRTLTVATTEPGLQFYSGNLLDGTIRGKAGRPYGRHAGFCLETQHFPDSPNHPQFPSTILRPGARFTSTTVYAFGVRR